MDWTQYETLKNKWLEEHPFHSEKDYEYAIQTIEKTLEGEVKCLAQMADDFWTKEE